MPKKTTVLCTKKAALSNGNLALQVHPGDCIWYMHCISFPAKPPLAPVLYPFRNKPFAHLPVYSLLVI